MAIVDTRDETPTSRRLAPAEAALAAAQDMNLCLVVPFGLQKEIYTWGLSCIRSYLGAHEPGVRTGIVDIRGDEFTIELKRRFGRDIARVLENLRYDQPVIMGQTAESVLGVVAAFGDRFVPVAREAGLFRSRRAARRVERRSAAAMKRLTGEVEGFLEARIRDELRRNAGKPTVWGRSVYDCTVAPVLMCARTIRRLDPESPIILGGGYFNAAFARRFAEGIEPGLVNGVVVGRGEDVILRLLRSYRNGTAIERNQIAGFYPVPPTGRPNGGPDGEIAVFLPGEEDAGLDWKPVNPVYHENMIRVFPQVGCSWGRCTFCDHIDKNQPAFGVLREDFFSRLTEMLTELSGAPATATDGTSTAAQPQIMVRLDGDEIDPELLAGIIERMVAVVPPSQKLLIRGWLQVKKFDEALGRVLFEHRHRIFADLICNAESFNLDALRAMKKGHTPLQAVYVIKAVIDTGHHAKTNVFTYYPREGFQGVSDEVALVPRFYHLLCSPKSLVDVRSYGANEIDEIFHNQEKFQLQVHRRKGDVWMERAFNVDLPLQHTAAAQQERRPFGREGVVVRCYARAIESAHFLLRRHRLLRNLDPGRRRVGPRAILGRFDPAEVLHAAETAGRILVLYLVTRFVGRDYWRRGRMWLHITKTANAAKRRNEAPSYFFLRDNVLTKRHRGWGRKENWQYKLSEKELAVLRYLYKVRKRRALFDRFRESIGEAGVESILRHQIELGSVVESHGSVLCVVNDPEYWEFEPGHWD